MELSMCIITLIMALDAIEEQKYVGLYSRD